MVDLFPSRGRRAIQAEILAAKRGSHSAINDAFPQPSLYVRAFVAREIAHEAADKRVSGSRRVDEILQWVCRRDEIAVWGR